MNIVFKEKNIPINIKKSLLIKSENISAAGSKTKDADVAGEYANLLYSV